MFTGHKTANIHALQPQDSLGHSRNVIRVWPHRCEAAAVAADGEQQQGAEGDVDSGHQRHGHDAPGGHVRFRASEGRNLNPT